MMLVRGRINRYLWAHVIFALINPTALIMILVCIYLVLELSGHSWRARLSLATGRVPKLYYHWFPKMCPIAARFLWRLPSFESNFKIAAIFYSRQSSNSLQRTSLARQKSVTNFMTEKRAFETLPVWRQSRRWFKQFPFIFSHFLICLFFYFFPFVI